MTKNTDREPFGEQSPIKNNQTVVVIDSNGEVVGTTYPKRAKGLIKKGRAEALTENVIRLGDFRPQDQITEEIKMDVLNEKVINNTNEQAVESSVENLWKAFTGKHEFIYFDPRNWYNNPDSSWGNRCERYMYQSPGGKMTEIYSLGDWSGHWSEIRSNFISVDPDTDYTFVFWLNGGENDRFNEVCRMIVVYTDSADRKIPDEDWQRNFIYKLNRGGVKPLKYVDGWYLFAIDLPKPEKKLLELRFAAQNAPMALKAAEEPSTYADIGDTPDEFADRRPQRHNIVFADGWPDDNGSHGSWYSTGNLKRQREAGVKLDGTWRADYSAYESETDSDSGGKSSANWYAFTDRFKELGDKFKGISGNLKVNGVDFSNLKRLSDIADNLDIDEIAEQVADNIDIDEIAEHVADNIDIDDIAEQVADSIDLDTVADNIDVTQVAAVLDIGGLADEVAERIDLDDLADKIAERLDIKGLLREILED